MGRAVLTTFFMLISSVYATTRTTHFRIQRSTGVIQSSTRVTCNKPSIIICGIRCTYTPNCVSFFHVERKKTWLKEIRTPHLEAAEHQSTTTTKADIRRQHNELCPGLPHLKHGTWRGVKTRDKKKVVTAHCHDGYTLIGHQKITCDLETNNFLRTHTDCKQSTWTNMNKIQTSIFMIELPMRLKYLSRIRIQGIFNQTATLYLQNSDMMSYKVCFILKKESVHISLIHKGRSKGNFSTRLRFDAPKQGLSFTMEISGKGNRLEYLLSMGKRLCPIPVSGLLEGVDRLMVDGDSFVKTIRTYVKGRRD